MQLCYQINGAGFCPNSHWFILRIIHPQTSLTSSVLFSHIIYITFCASAKKRFSQWVPQRGSKEKVVKLDIQFKKAKIIKRIFCKVIKHRIIELIFLLSLLFCANEDRNSNLCGFFNLWKKIAQKLSSSSLTI